MRTETPTLPPPRSADGPVIVIDPGHSGSSISSIDATTGLRDIDYPNYPEIYEVFDISTCVAQGLRTDGYRVVLTKRRALDSVGLAARARIADEADAALAISVHDDHSQTSAFQATYSQRGLKRDGRYPAMYRGSGASRTVYDHPAAARASERAASLIARERTAAQGRRVSVRENTFTGRPPLEPGNLALVQLLSRVPWVYNEAGARVGGSTTTAMSIATERAYAKGLLLGVQAAVPLASGRVTQPSRGLRGLRACLVDQLDRTPRPERYQPRGT